MANCRTRCRWLTVTRRGRADAAHSHRMSCGRCWESRQRSNLAWRLEAACPLPRGQQFALMQGGPFRHHSQGASRETATQDGQRGEADENLVLTILGMEVGRVVVVVEDLDDDAVETGDLRHARWSGPAP